MAKLSDAQLAFVRDNPYLGVITTLRPDGSPHSTVVWVDADESGITVNTAHGRTKPRNIAADPRIALLVVNPEDDYQWLSLNGTATLSDDGAEDQIDRLARKYLGAEAYPWRREGERRVTVVVTPTRIESLGIED
jgi:PPOX class probable F420-dependent enzyme